MNSALRLSAVFVAPSSSHTNPIRADAQFRRDLAHKLLLERAPRLNRVRELHGGAVLHLNSGPHRASHTPRDGGARQPHSRGQRSSGLGRAQPVPGLLSRGRRGAIRAQCAPQRCSHRRGSRRGRTRRGGPAALGLLPLLPKPLLLLAVLLPLLLQPLHLLPQPQQLHFDLRLFLFLLLCWRLPGPCPRGFGLSLDSHNSSRSCSLSSNRRGALHRRDAPVPTTRAVNMLAAMKPDETVALCAGVAGHPKGKDKAAQTEHESCQTRLSDRRRMETYASSCSRLRRRLRRSGATPGPGAWPASVTAYDFVSQ